jgi:hypothetical protein
MYRPLSESGAVGPAGLTFVWVFPSTSIAPKRLPQKAGRDKKLAGDTKNKQPARLCLLSWRDGLLDTQESKSERYDLLEVAF